MIKLIRSLCLSTIFLLVLASCSFPPKTPKVDLTITASPPGPYNTVGQVLKLSYSIKNTGTAPLPGFVAITSDNTTVTCPGVNTIGNLDDTLDVNETIVCDADYAITQADLDKGSLKNTAKASVGGTDSNQANFDALAGPTTIQPLPVLTLTSAANPSTYDQVGQTITLTYVITNNGTASLGPAQFTVTDSLFGPPFNCPDSTTTLATNSMVACTATHIITQADIDAPSVTSSATAAGGGAGPSPSANFTITKNIVVTTTTIQHTVVAGEGLSQIARCYGADPNEVIQANPQISNPNQIPANTIVTVPNTGSVGAVHGPPCLQYNAGETIQHTVVAGEWMWQIARCYGADPTKVIQANPQLPNPAMIKAGTSVTVPNIGSVGSIVGPPCVEVIPYTVQSGDTWNSIAQKFSADPTVLKMANPTSILTVGSVLNLRVPHNSVGGTTPISNLIRINFAAGASSATVTGTARAGNFPVHYVLNASQGQVMTVKLKPADNSVNMTIVAPDGSTLKPYDLVFTWSGTLPATGDYRLDVSNALGLGTDLNIPFTLEVSITGSVVSGNIHVGEQSTMGGKAGTPLDIKVRFEASSTLANVTEMRIKQDASGTCLTPEGMNDAPWETFVAEKNYSYTPPINWSTFKLHVQYRDAQLNQSPVYCGEVAVEGTP